MDRLTVPYGYAPGYYRRTGVSMKDVFNRLAAYEDTGLTPEEITNLHYDHQEFRRYVAGNARLRAERDKAVEDITHDCDTCLYADCAWDKPPCETCIEGEVLSGIKRTDNWQWRGTEGKA